VGFFFVKMKRGRKEKKVLRECETCGREFYAVPSKIKIGRGRFCSRPCFDKWHSKYLVGERSSNWKGGYIRITEYRKKVEDFIGRKLVKGEIVHHIDGDHSNNDIGNLFLCKSNNHQIMHWNLMKVAYQMVRDGIIVFDRKTGTYKKNIYFRRKNGYLQS